MASHVQLSDPECEVEKSRPLVSLLMVSSKYIDDRNVSDWPCM